MINFNLYTSNHLSIDNKVIIFKKNNQATQNDCDNILYLIRNHRIPYMSPLWIVNS